MTPEVWRAARAVTRGSASCVAPHGSPGTGERCPGSWHSLPACYDYLATRPSGIPPYQECLKAAAMAQEAPQHTLVCD